jgi:hypothetical protein
MATELLSAMIITGVRSLKGRYPETQQGRGYRTLLTYPPFRKDPILDLTAGEAAPRIWLRKLSHRRGVHV